MTIYNATARTEESIRKERSLSESEEIVSPSFLGVCDIYVYKDARISNRSLIQRIELIVKDAKKKNCDHAIISGDEVVETLLTREFEKHGIGVSWTSDWMNDAFLKEIEKRLKTSETN